MGKVETKGTTSDLGPSIKGSLKRWVYILACVLIFIWVFQTNFLLVGSHGHSHDEHDHEHDDDGHGHAHHHEEPPSFKYSKQANEQFVKEAKPASSQKAQLPSDTPPPPPVERNPNLWFDAIASTLFISAAPFFILFLIPLDNSKEKRTFLKVLLSFASGGLLGDAFLHLIPHAIMAKGGGGGDDGHGHSHSHSHGHSHGGHKDDDEEGESHFDEFHGHDLSVGIWVLVGIITFLMVEKLIRIIKGKGHVHSHSHASPNVLSDESEQESKTSKDKKDGASKTKGGKSADKTSKAAKKVVKTDDGEIKVAGYLNLAADFTHNFTDGLAIGASYLAGRSVGLVTTFTILLHEVPHEIGDFAILIQSGCSKKKAIALQLITALGAVSGTVISLLAEGAGETATTWILPFTAGGFIYIATVSVIPELLHDSKFKESVLEIFALLAGVYMMVLIAKYE